LGWSCVCLRQVSTYAVVFSRSSFVLLHAGLLGRIAIGLHVLCLQCDPCQWLWNRACTPSNGNQCETWELRESQAKA